MKRTRRSRVKIEGGKVGFSGPLPKHPSQRKRRNASIALKPLPAMGRVGRCPHFPLPEHPKVAERDAWEREVGDLKERLLFEEDGRKARRLEGRIARAQVLAARLADEVEKLDKLERKLWTQLWETPMAVEWEKLNWVHEVAQYCRHRALGELGNLADSKMALAYANTLGLTPASLLRLRWEVANVAVMEEQRPRASVTNLNAARNDFA